MTKLQLNSSEFLDRHNDFLQIEITPTDKTQFRLSDGGYIISDLEICGADREKVLKFIKKFKRIKTENNKITLYANKDALYDDIGLFFKALSEISNYETSQKTP